MARIVHRMTTSDYLPPRATLLGRLVPEGGGGKGYSSQSSEPGGGKFIPSILPVGNSLLGGEGTSGGSLCHVSSCDFPSDTEAIELVICLGKELASSCLKS
jgi:hypothetical protein